MPSHSRRASDPFRDNPATERLGPALPPKEDMLSAVRESVTVKPITDPRAKVGRSHTANAAVTGSTTPPRSRRSTSTDSVPSPVEKPSKPRSKASKKASMHADIIDRLDFSGVGAAMLHHDGPFDACAPSRNKHKHKAPMMAWGAENDDSADLPTDRRLSPLAQSALVAMANYDSPYYAANLYPSSPSSPDSIPKKRVDALAEAWGIAEPEPFEEFHAGGGERSAASSIKNGKEGHNSSRRSKDARDTYKEYLDEGRPNRRVRSTLPPPQPISLPGSRSHNKPSSPRSGASPDHIDTPLSPHVSTDGSPRRSRSFMSRIRQMRDAPNVPVAHDEETEPSDSMTDSVDGGVASAAATRASHKHQTSFLGRFRSPGGGLNNTSPTPDTPASGDFVYVDDGATPREKELPAPPSDKDRDYFGDAANSPGRGLGRKTSLMKKVVRGVRGRGAKH